MVRGRKTSLSITLSAEDRRTLESWRRSTTIRAGLAKRGRVILCIADGLSVVETIRRVGISKRLVYKWVERFRTEGIDGLHDKPRSGRPPTFSPGRRGAPGEDGVRAA
jgi:hypothetical protein